MRFTTGTQYEVVDGASNVTGTGTYKTGDDLEVNGVRLRITGAPAAGDSFNDAGGQQPRHLLHHGQPGGRAERRHWHPCADGRAADQLQSALRDVARASERMIDSRAAGGAQLKRWTMPLTCARPMA